MNQGAKDAARARIHAGRWLLAGSLSVAALAHPAAPATAAAFEGSADGAVIYQQSCAVCHGTALQGAAGPALSGPGFDARWRGKERALHDVVAATMPINAAGSLPPMAYNAVVGYIIGKRSAAGPP